ncbi:hypothetical protein H0H93_010280 [Arthromyces matolae]|nr:hypothetical protein H0H93_010280 [Arthromyces matolae]
MYGSTAQHAWESPRRQSSPYTRSPESEFPPRSGWQQQQQQQNPRRPGPGAHYEPWKPPPQRPRSQYVDLNEKALEHLERELEIQRISGSWRAIQILGVMSLTVMLLGFR